MRKNQVNIMLKKICLLLCAISSLCAQENTLQKLKGAALKEGSIGLKLMHDKDGKLYTAVYDAYGKNEPLTFGNFISFSVDAILKGKIKECQVKQTQPIFVGYEWQGDILKSDIRTIDGKKSPFYIPNFLGTLSDTITTCKTWDKTLNPQPKDTSAIFFEKMNNDIETMIIDHRGKKIKLNLGRLLSISSVAFTPCSPDIEKDRMLQIFIESTDQHVLKVYQMDAYGNKADFNFNNFAAAVARTLDKCPEDISKQFVKPSANSIKIKFENNQQGELETYLITPSGERVELNLGTLLTASAQLVPYYEGTTDMLVITYTRDKDGEVRGTLINLNGQTTDLNIENLVKAAATFPSY